MDQGLSAAGDRLLLSLLLICDGRHKQIMIFPTPLFSCIKWIAIAAFEPTLLDTIVITPPRNRNQRIDIRWQILISDYLPEDRKQPITNFKNNQICNSKFYSFIHCSVSFYSFKYLVQLQKYILFMTLGKIETLQSLNLALLVKAFFILFQSNSGIFLLDIKLQLGQF